MTAPITDITGRHLAPPQSEPPRTSMCVTLHFRNGQIRTFPDATSVQQYEHGAIVEWATGWMNVGWDEARIEIHGAVVARAFGTATAIEPAWFSELATL